MNIHEQVGKKVELKIGDTVVLVGVVSVIENDDEDDDFGEYEIVVETENGRQFLLQFPTNS